MPFGPCENSLLLRGLLGCSYRHIWNAIVYHSPIAVCVVDIQGQWLFPHPKICEWLGYTENELMTRTFQDVTHPDDLEEDLRNARRLLNKEIEYYQMEKRYIHKNGSEVWVNLTGTAVPSVDGNIVGFVAQIENISDRKKYQRQLEQLTLTDYLTGLGNQRHFKNELKRHWRILQRPEQPEIPFGLIMIDVDSFKAVNDIYGHSAGDEVLKDVSNRIMGATRVEDLKFREHGDEFAVIMPCTSDIEPAIARLESHLCSSVEYEGVLIHYICSVGGAVCDRSVTSLKELYKSADLKMYEKKRDRKRQEGSQTNKRDRLARAGMMAGKRVVAR